MSFIRMGRSHSATSFGRKKKPVKKKPVWDDTNNDLTVHKATPDEIVYRKVSHQSKNIPGVRLERHRKPSRRNVGDGSISPLSAHHMAIVKEVLYDQQQLQDTLRKSERMMAEVKDLFGDDPRRYAGIPSVTDAPYPGEDANRGTGVLPVMPHPPTQLEILSDSMMDPSALNEPLATYLTSSDEDEDGEAQEPILYQPKLDLKRFQQFLAAENSSLSGAAQGIHNVGPTGQSTKVDSLISSIPQESYHGTPVKEHDESIENLRTPGSAANDTNKINKTRARVPLQELSQTHSGVNMKDLRQVLDELETEIVQYEHETGRRTTADPTRHETFSGYTMALVSAVRKLTQYQKESDLRLRAEAIVREQLTQDIVQFRMLIDALTSDLITVQEECHSIYREFNTFRSVTQQQIVQLQGSDKNTQSNQETVFQTPPKKPETESRAPPSHEENPKDQPDGGAAFMLSPPVQRTRINLARSSAAPPSSSAAAPTSSSSAAPPSSSAAAAVQPAVYSVSVPKPTPLVNAARTTPQVQSNLNVDLRPPEKINSQSFNGSNVTNYGVATLPISNVSNGAVQDGDRVIRQGNRIDSSGMKNQQLSKSDEHSLDQYPQYSDLEGARQRTVMQNGNRFVEQEATDIGGTMSRAGVDMRKEDDTNQEGVEREAVAAQIADLNRQHAEARRRLQILMQQQPSAGRPNQGGQEAFHLNDALALPMFIAATGQLSPSISPISRTSGHHRTQQGNMTQESSGAAVQGITVSIPQVALDHSDTCSPSPNIPVSRMPESVH